MSINDTFDPRDDGYISQAKMLWSLGILGILYAAVALVFGGRRDRASREE